MKTLLIYQIPSNRDDLRELRFTNYDLLKKLNLEIKEENYELIYKNKIKDDITLDDIYREFNINKPNNYKGRSLSVSDIIVIEDEKTQSYFIDSIGFKELKNFKNTYKGEDKMFKYTYRTRGFSIGCQPKDFIKFEEGEHKFETIYYNRKLTKKEIDEYELIDLNPKKLNKFNVNIEEVLSRTIEIEAETELEALELALEQYNNEEIILDDRDYIGTPNIKIY